MFRLWRGDVRPFEDQKPATRRSVVGLADLQGDTPWPRAATPTGAGATPAPCQKPGRASGTCSPCIACPKPRALTGRGSRLAIGTLTHRLGEQRAATFSLAGTRPPRAAAAAAQPQSP
jgi:hypothetical protein